MQQTKRWAILALQAVGWLLFAWAIIGLVVEFVNLATNGTGTSGDSPAAATPRILFEAAFAAVLFFVLRRRPRVQKKAEKVEAVRAAEVEQYANSWTQRDEALLQTIETVGNFHRGRADLVPARPTMIALRYNDEVVVGEGPYQMIWWGRVGDGSWSTNGFVAAGTGAVGLGLVAGSIIGSSVAESRARARAAADATMTWRAVDRGTILVSSYGFYLTGGEYGYRAFEWSHIVSAQMVGEGVLEYSAETNQGTQTWRITSDWSEMIFGLWALVRNQQHPQWLAGSWYPADVMRARLAHFGKSPVGVTETLPFSLAL